MARQSLYNTKSLKFKNTIKNTAISIVILIGLGTLSGCQTTHSLPNQAKSTSVTQPPATRVIESSNQNIEASSRQDQSQSPNQSLNKNRAEDKTDIDQRTSSSHSNIDPYPAQNQTPSVSQTPANTANDAESDNASAEVIIIPPLPKEDDATIQERLLQQARHNSQQGSTTSNPTLQNGDNIPAFRRLMDTGVSQLRQGQLSAAESTFTRAQRLAPQSAAVYFYLGQVALKKNQPLKAEAMGRRGLVVARTAERKKVLWQLILKSGQAQGNSTVINEANAALSAY